MFASDTNRAQRVSRLLSAAECRGLDSRTLLRQIELSKDQIREPDGRVPVVKTLRLWHRIADQIDDPDLGLAVGSSFKTKEAGVVGYAMFYSDTLLGALKRIVRFAKLLNQRAELALEDQGNRWRLQALHRPLIPNFRQPVDEGVAGLVTCFREITGRDLVPAALQLPYSKPADTKALRQLFGADLQFDATAAAIDLWDRDVRAPTQAADSSLTRYLDELAQIHLEALPTSNSHSDMVRQAVWPHLSEGLPPLGQIASELAMSARSLQRRLREEGTTFAEVVDGLRREKAKLFLRDPNLAVYEVGYLLGYSDPSTFHRAFRRWEGTSPSRFRAQYFN